MKWFERNSRRSKLLIETPLFLFHRTQWGCTYLAFIRGGSHGGYRINFTWYKGTFAVACIAPSGPTWQHSRWAEFDAEMRASREQKIREQYFSSGGIQ